MCSGFEAGSYLRHIDIVYHSTLGLRVIKKKKILCRVEGGGWRVHGSGFRDLCYQIRKGLKETLGCRKRVEGRGLKDAVNSSREEIDTARCWCM